MTEQKNLLIAVAASIAILLAFQVFYETPRMQQQQQQQQADAQRQEALTSQPAAGPGTASDTEAERPTPPTAQTQAQSGTAAPEADLPGAGSRSRAAVLQEQVDQGERIRIVTPRLNGSMRIVGGRIDDLTLRDYHETTDPSSPEIVLLSPVGAPQPYYAEFGWVADSSDVAVPDARTPWTASSRELTPEKPVTLTWDNGQGLVFEKTITVDDNFMFTVQEKVRNTGTSSVILHSYGLVSRHGTPHTMGYYILHEGPLGVFDGKLQEWKYTDVQEAGKVDYQTTGGWVGITDKYWLVSLVPDQTTSSTARILNTKRGTEDRYQVDTLGNAVRVAPGQTVDSTVRLFAGAKQVRLIDHYAEQYNISHFDLAIDFGWFYFLTKPFFYAIDYLYMLVGNFGVAILLFTVLIKLLFYPLADKSYQAMSKMKKIQPELMKLRERYADDKDRLNLEMMRLYKREGANPVAGCLPVLIQIPVFFALYKVLFVTIEMRHAPFFGWIQDLSAPDPTTIFNLFGLIPWDPPHMLMLGVWPLIMGVSMWFQQLLNPAPPDPVQAKIFMFLPILFTFLLAGFPAGLVIYWAWNNILSIAQQWWIMRKMGVKI